VATDTDSKSVVEVWGPGSEVLVGDHGLIGRVTAVKIMPGNLIMYECVWWNDHSREAEWLDDWEIRPNGDKARRLRVDQVL
jgi:hypothetical protein